MRSALTKTDSLFTISYPWVTKSKVNSVNQTVIRVYRNLIISEESLRAEEHLLLDLSPIANSVIEVLVAIEGTFSGFLASLSLQSSNHCVIDPGL